MKLLLASDYGVPQHRHRLFIIASRTGILPPWPSKSTETITVRDAIGDLQFSNQRQEGEVSIYLNGTPQHDSYAGKMRRHINKKIIYNHNPAKARIPKTGTRRKLEWDSCSPTVLATKESRDACLNPGNFSLMA